MIEGAERFHYIGLIRNGHAVLMVFREGVLTLDTAMEGWGAMAPADLRRLVPGSAAREPSPLTSDSDTTFSARNAGRLTGRATKPV